MTIEEITFQKLNRLKTVPDALIDSMGNVEDGAYRRVLTLISGLDQENGLIVNNERNMAILNGLDEDLKDLIFKKDYFTSVVNYSKEFDAQAKLNNSYFDNVFDGFSKSEKYDDVLKATQKSAIQLLSEDKFTETLITPIQQSLQSSIINGQSFAETADILRNVIVGGETTDGKLLSYVKTIAYDAFAISDRTYTNVVSNDLGAQWFRYSGGEIAGTRCFCEERMGKYFHKKEIEAWGRGEDVGICGPKWKGRNPATNAATIFSFAGGYNCKHSILPVSLKSVPKSVIERAIEKGYYIPN